jgi:hypothetical protein
MQIEHLIMTQQAATITNTFERGGTEEAEEIRRSGDRVIEKQTGSESL